MHRGGARVGAGRKPGTNKVPKSIKLDKSLTEELEKINSDKSFISKIEEGLQLYIEKYKK